MVSRRELRLASLDDAVRDAEQLVLVGYEKAGYWDLAQCLGHLSEWMSYPMDGFPKTPLLLRPIFFLVRQTRGPKFLQNTIESGVMAPGIPTIPASVPPPGGNERDAIARYRELVRQFQVHSGPFHPSPLAGAMDKPTLERLHTVHAAHHLSYLVPRG